MTRTGTKWITMAIVLVLTAGAWAQRERQGDRERPVRRPKARSMADRPRADREQQERENRNRERQRVEREEREEQERPNRDREQARRDEHRRDEPRRGKPDVRIFRFEHIPAESFMEVLGQLSQRGPLRELLSHIPVAVHQHSNAVVVIAPPEAMELFERLADGLDAPSAFHERMARVKKPGAPRQPILLRKPGAPKKPAPKKPAPPKRPAPGKGPGGINEAEIGKALGNPVGQFFCKALSEQVAGELRLDKRQIEAMRKVAQQCGQKVGHMRDRVIQAIRNMPPDQRAANARKIVSQVRGEMGKMAGEARKHVFGILKPEQRKPAARLLGAPGPTGAKGAKSKAPTKGKPAATGKRGSKPTPTAVPGKPRPAAAPSGCGGCSSRKIVLGDSGNCKIRDF